MSLHIFLPSLISFLVLGYAAPFEMAWYGWAAYGYLSLAVSGLLAEERLK